jgi:hypothetical protein
VQRPGDGRESHIDDEVGGLGHEHADDQHGDPRTAQVGRTAYIGENGSRSGDLGGLETDMGVDVRVHAIHSAMPLS